ncbi:MAG: DUF1893 domain-containing protein [Dehalococcoidia bacterium]|nr:MAG: DUF1893 domain-containing protein [Dehalococcoidia bacterium]
MEDIERGRYRLKQERLNLVMAKGGQVLATSDEKGVCPFFEAFLDNGSGFHGAAVADRIVRLSPAMFCVYAQIASVYASVASKGELAMLSEQGINAATERKVSSGLNPDGTDLCPFAKLAQRMNSPSQLFSALELMLAKAN